jgi:hypothetical protein
MASNTTLNSGTGGDIVTTKERTHDGDATKTQVVNVAGVTGSEGSYTHTDVAAGGGVEAAALRVTIASDSTGVLSVDDNGSSLTVDGTVTVVGSAAEDAAASGNPVLVGGRYDSSARTLETGDVGAIALNASGQVLVEIAAGAGSGGTAAADDADFTAGTTSGTPAMGVYESTPTTVTDGDLGTVGITANREVKVSVTSGGITGRAEDAAHSTGHEGVVILAVRRDSAAVGSDTDGDYSTINVNSSGRVYTDAAVSSLPASTNTIEVVGDAAADAAVAGNPLYAGARASTATPSAVSGDGDAVGLWATREGALVTVGAIVDDAAFTPGTSRAQPIAFQADETATDSVDEGDAGCPRMTLDRKVIVTPYAHAAAGGATPLYNLDVDETEDAVKASAGKLMMLHVINLANAKRYLKIYNDTTANVTVGTTTPTLSLPIPTMGDTNGAGFTLPIPDCGIQFKTAITIAATTGFADNDTGAPGANEVIVNLAYA